MDEQVPTPREAELPDAPELLEQAVYGDEARAGHAVGLDPHDFAGLYVRHRSSFSAQARRFLRDPRDVDEVVQEAFLRLFLALPELGTELQAIAYCRRTITNLCIDRYRADQRRPRLLGLESAPAEVLLEDEPADPVVQAEDAAVVREALARLQPLHREALLKREIEEKPLPVIAAELDVPEESVKHLLFRARRALRRLLAGSTADPAALVRMAAGSGGKLGVLIALLVMGLGSGPDLRVVPVVGKDLPDLPSVAEVVTKSIPEAIKKQSQPAAEDPAATGGSTTDGSTTDGATTQDGGSGDADLAPGPEVVPAVPAPATATTASPTPSPSSSPTLAPTPVASPKPSPTASPTATPAPTEAATAPAAAPTAQPDRPRPGSAVVGASPSPSGSPSGTAEPREPSASPAPEQDAQPTSSPSPTAAPTKPAPQPTVFATRLPPRDGG